MTDEEYERAHAEYARARDAWLAAHHPELVGAESLHTCGLSWDPDVPDVQVEQLDAAAEVWGAYRFGGGQGFGPLEAAVAAAAGRATDDAWVAAVSAAARRERERAGTGWRRFRLLALPGDDTWFHTTPARNRSSIERFGLDWSHMTPPGIAGSHAPEWPGIFLARDDEEARWFAWMCREPCDIWSVDATGIWLEGDPGSDGGGGENWMIAPQRIPPDRLRLVERDIRPRREHE